MLTLYPVPVKNKKNRPSSLHLYLAFLLTLNASRTFAQPVDLIELSLEELMDVEVTSVSRRPKKKSQAAAAVAVISRADIRRAGITSIPEATRLAPGIQVARIDANKWGITTRGFNDLFPNKLLVLIDGRSVYTPLFSGVFWEAQDVLLEDVERIEVIRGPGDDLVDASGRPRSDAWEAGRGGGRADWQLSDGDHLSLQAAVYKGELGQTFSAITAPDFNGSQVFNSTTPFSGGHVLGRWQRRAADGGDLALQIYYDRTSATPFGPPFRAPCARRRASKTT